MEITHREFKRVDLVKVSGRVDSNTAPDLEATLTSITDDGRYRIVLDISDLEYVSSAGLRVLVSVAKDCRRYNRGDLRLAAVPDQIQSVLELAGFDILFKTYPDTTSAVGSY